MSFFAMPYRVLFHDTMSYGTHHLLTNFKFQCEARDELFFRNVVDSSASGRADHDRIVLLTQQAYARNLAPVTVGERVAILMSAEEPTLSSVRFCFRVIRHDGVPVSCGFQTVVCLSRTTKNVVAAPPSIQRGREVMAEKLHAPSFRERVLSGALKEIFDPATIALGCLVANAPPEMSAPRFIDADQVCDRPDAEAGLRLARGLVFMTPGQGSYDPTLLRELRDCDPEAAALLRRADAITAELLGETFKGALSGNASAAHQSDLVQVGIYLGAILPALYLMRHGVVPDLLVGHSAGELAALALAGVYSVEDGLRLVCHRARALRDSAREAGAMLALFCDRTRAAALVEVLRPSTVTVAVVNHDEQTVVSASHADLARMESLAAHVRLGCARLHSPYPFHSPLLEPAVAPFAATLREWRFSYPRIPVYSPIEREIVSTRPDLADAIASHFIRSFDFSDAIRRVHGMGARAFVECGAGGVLSQFLRRVLHGEPDLEIDRPIASGRSAIDGLNEVIARRGAAASVHVRQPSAREVGAARHGEPATGEIPVAIVSMGCVLPGAPDPRVLWESVLERRSGITDAARVAPELAAAFKHEGGIVPDKTYTLLGGFVAEKDIDGSRPALSPEELKRLPRGQRFLAATIAQCLAGIAEGAPLPPSQRTRLFIGSTADGSIEHDEALLAASMHAEVDALDCSAALRQSLKRALEHAIGRSPGDVPATAPVASHVAVAERLLGAGVEVLAVDAACASSLYAIDLGVRALRDGDCDIALCGGVFAPGPANSCLFAQFGGLSATGSRPLDAAADGVVFGEGAALVALKRLPDALADGDRIHAVIRAVGLGDDGKSPSVAVPQKEGQARCLSRTYARCRIDPKTIQYVEAHATATPVGDAVEFAALKEVFGERAPELPRIELGSIKALIGHTGWTAGAASVIKVACALEAAKIPPQANWSTPNRNIDLERSPFTVSTAARSWPENPRGEVRRAAVNGFGFGGSNAHAIIEAFDPAYHRPRWAGRAHRVRASEPMVVLGVGRLFPFPDGEAAGGHRHLRFDQAVLRLPAGVRVLPDVAEQMDRGQFLAVMAAEAAMTHRSELSDLRAMTGVVLAVVGKTGRGIQANRRIYLDYLRARLDRLGGDGPVDPQLARLRDQLFAALQRSMPSNPYTLPGLMPNVTAGRVANVFNLGGANMVVDTGARSLYSAITIAEKLLRHGECDLVLAGGVNGYAGAEAHLLIEARRPVAEAAIILLLARRDLARVRQLTVLAEVSVVNDTENDTEDVVTLEVGADPAKPHLMGAEGALEFSRALDAIAAEGRELIVRWPAQTETMGPALRLTPVTGRVTAAASGPSAESLADATVRTPVYCCTPELVETEIIPAQVTFSLRDGRVLVLTDQPGWFASPDVARALAYVPHTVICPSGAAAPGAIPVDLSSDERARAALQSIDIDAYHAILVVKNLAGVNPVDAVLADTSAGGGLLYLLFAVARRAVEQLSAGQVALASVCLGAPSVGGVAPFAGLLAGFMKAVAREFPRALCRALSTDANDLARALAELETDCRQPRDAARPEVVYRSGRRHVVDLRRLPGLRHGGAPWLSADAVVIATGGARGVTAALVEELLRRFGCTIILLGRSDLAAVPGEILSMDSDAFAAWESRFYRDERVRRTSAKPAELRKAYAALQAAREATETLARLRRLSGRVEYHCADVTDRRAVAGLPSTRVAIHAAQRTIAARCGSL